jgi:hypothetical protein
MTMKDELIDHRDSRNRTDGFLLESDAEGIEAADDSRPKYGRSHVRPSRRHRRYFETADGKTFIPIGMNLCFPRHVTDRREGLDKMFRWLDRLADNGGNFARLFLGHPFFDIECGRFGVFDEEKASRLDAVLDHAWKQGVRLKLTIDLFRTIQMAPQAETFPGAVSFSKPNFHIQNGGPFRDMDEYLASDKGRRHFLQKLDWLGERYGRHPGIFGWDLWNEMNAVVSSQWTQWTQAMLPELKKRFPHHLAMQTLGSMDADNSIQPYAEIMALPSNEISQAHRYLDTGASWEICHGPVDVMVADAVETILRIAPDKPAVLAEGGATEWRHSAPWVLFPADKEGILLHDVLFAPYFAGAAGGGQAWHWQEYVDPNNLWWHFARFAQAIRGADPVAQRFVPQRWDVDGLRVYALVGRSQCLVWCRDALSDWKTELVDHVPARLVTNATLSLPVNIGAGWRSHSYDPWTQRTTGILDIVGDRLPLEPFKRSLVVRLERAENPPQERL